MKKITVLAFSVLAALVLTSCGSTPKTEVETPAEKVPETPVVETPVAETVDVAAITAQIDASRQIAIDAGADTAAPDLLKNLDDYYESLKSNPELLASSAADLNLKYKTLASYAKAKDLKSQIDSKKSENYDKKDYNSGVAGLEKLEAAYASTDAMSAETAAAADSAIADFTVVMTDLELRNSKLEVYNKTKDLKTQIDEHELSALDSKDYDEGVKNLELFESALKSEEAITADDAATADKAFASFTAVYVVGYKKLAKDERAAAYDAKKLADSVKAAVSRKAEYKAATEAFQKGDTLYSMQNAPKALENYTSAKEQYEYLYKDVSEKRAAAMAVLEAAKKSVEESEQYAADADSQAPLTQKVDGIEDEDAVLLESDNYENPEDAEIDVSEELTVIDQLNIVSGEAENALQDAGVQIDIPTFGQEK